MQILVALVSAYRYDGNEISEEMAESEARILHDEIHRNDRNPEETVRILSTRSKAQLNATFNHYKDIYKTSITKVHSYLTPRDSGVCFLAFTRTKNKEPVEDRDIVLKKLDRSRLSSRRD